MKYDLIIIGGGASGLCAAINAKKKKNKILIIEHKSKPGKKILSTGNGKCNLSNVYCKNDMLSKNPEGIFPYFTSGKIDFITNALEKFDIDSTIDFFNELGVLHENMSGYIYPRSQQASTICDCLVNRCKMLDVDIITDYEPVNIEKKGSLFNIDNTYYSKNLLIATGGMAAPRTGSDGSGYKIAKKFGHSIIDPRPSLCGIKCKDKFLNELSGVRNDAMLSLYDSKGRLIISSKGNLQYASYGLSGIPAFQISSELGRVLKYDKNPIIKIDNLPELNTKQIKNFIDKKNNAIWEKSSQDKLPYILNKKICNVLEKEIHKKYNNGKDISLSDKAMPFIKGLTFHPYDLNSFDESQVTAGGVSTSEIYSDSMKSKLVDGLYFSGEIIDVNGICGGYNLQWAWSTGYIAALDISGE